MIAKAVANNLAEKISEKRGEKIKGFFLNIKGPELLNKYVGETERKIREIFVKAKEKAAEDVPVIVFFDEMDALFRTRGTGISSDVETTIVPQLLAEIDGVEGLKNVIVIGASNRYIGRGEKGITAEDLLTAVREEFKENEDLPNTTHPDDWAKIAGKKGERIVSVKSLTSEPPSQKRSVERIVTTGQYL